jgi:hypothetical protein
MALVKNKAGKVSVPWYEKHQQQANSRTDQDTQGIAGSSAPPIDAAETRDVSRPAVRHIPTTRRNLVPPIATE